MIVKVFCFAEFDNRNKLVVSHDIDELLQTVKNKILELDPGDTLELVFLTRTMEEIELEMLPSYQK